MNDIPDWLAAARDHWRWRGDDRPSFAIAPGPGQTSVWDYPRPPGIVADGREVVIRCDDVEIARTRAAVKVCETSHPPTWYLPAADVDPRFVEAAGGGSFCEWKGPARYWNVRVGNRVLNGVAWSYPQPLAGAEILKDRFAFYASRLTCLVDGVRATPQPGGFYGGWITPELTGPFKGEPGSEGW
jgi:uncharacterized protein (DUF427 family)